ncbi:MAG: nucleoside deaminase [Gemmataceae bacterium]
MNLGFLREAIRLSVEKMEANEGGPFGAVVVRNGEIVGRGWNRVHDDPTAHAEVVAIRDACSRLKTFSLAGVRDMQLRAVPAWPQLSRLDRIYYAATCDDAAAAGFDDRSFYQEIRKPAGERAIPMEQAATSCPQAWAKKEDRIRY